MKCTEKVNELVVKIFNDVLFIESKALAKDLKKNMSITEIHTIEAIGSNSKKSMSEIAKSLNITVGTLTTAINNLVKKGCVEREKHANDKRVVMVGLTKEGRRIYKKHANFHIRMIKASLTDFTDEEKRVLIKLLNKMDYFLRTEHENLSN